MSDSIGSSFDILNRTQTRVDKDDYDAYVNRWELKEKEDAMMEDKTKLSFTDMLGLMVAQFQNQTIDHQADTNDMMNQLIQMTMMQGMTKMTTQMEDLTQANILSYSASLVGKEVTVGVKDEEGNLQEIVGTVTAAGTYDGHPVIFIGDKSYLLSSIMAVGKLPEIKDPEKPGEGDGDGTDPDGDGNGTDPVDPPENNGGTESGGGAGDSGGDRKSVV